MPNDLPLWMERFAELLGCDPRPASIAVAIEDLLAERERQRAAIGRLRGRRASARRASAPRTSGHEAGLHEAEANAAG